MCVVHDGSVGEVVVCTVGWRLGVFFLVGWGEKCEVETT